MKRLLSRYERFLRGWARAQEGRRLSSRWKHRRICDLENFVYHMTSIYERLSIIIPLNVGSCQGCQKNAKRISRQSVIGREVPELERKRGRHRGKEGNLWFISNVTLTLLSTSDLGQACPRPLSSSPLSSMDPAAVAQIAQMGLDLSVVSLSLSSSTHR